MVIQVKRENRGLIYSKDFHIARHEHIPGSPQAGCVVVIPVCSVQQCVCMDPECLVTQLRSKVTIFIRSS